MFLLVVCSIIGYKGKLSAAPVLVNSLKRMEYRGYDSVGVATLQDGNIILKKGVGKVIEVSNSLELKNLPGMIGIGHTRWATHGGVNDSNAHPHSTCNNKIAVVHNGIIDNYKELRDELIKNGHIFKSQTDSEVIAHILEEEFQKTKDIETTMMKTCKKLIGSYAFVAIFEDGTLAGARYDEPLILGLIDDGYFISSDVLGFLEYTDKAIFLDNKDIVIIKGNSLNIIDFDGRLITRNTTQVAWELGAADKGKYAHYTIKEINEQTRTIFNATDQNKNMLDTVCNILKNANSIFFTGSGTSYHSALIAKHVFGKYAKMRTETIMSSEFKYYTEDLDKDSVLFAVSQSGETADVLQTVKAAKEKGVKILSIVNITTSSLARMSDAFLVVNCGPEIGVAATKSFTGQLAVIFKIVDQMTSSKISVENSKDELQKAIHEVLSYEDKLASLLIKFHSVKDIYILGRSINYPIALEGALKIKELAYIHAEGIAAGELKHGPLALIDSNSLVIVLNPRDSTFEDTLSSAHEIKARGAIVIGISDIPNDIYDYFIPLPKVKEIHYPFLEVIPLQLMSYHLALGKKVDPDYPRNLAKSVTVK